MTDMPVSRAAQRGFFRRLGGALSALGSALDGARGGPVARAIGAAAARLDRRGALVFADLPGWPRPPLIGGFVPSVYAVLADREVVLWVEPADGASALTDRRHHAFSAWAAAAPEREYDRVNQ